MRVSIDVGGTFTDLVLDFGDGALKMFKAQTTNPDPLDGIFSAPSGSGSVVARSSSF